MLRLPLLLGNVLELVDRQHGRTHGVVATVLLVGAEVAVGHGGDGLRVQELEMVVLMEGIHVEFPAEIGEDLLGAEVVVVLEAKA